MPLANSLQAKLPKLLVIGGEPNKQPKPSMFELKSTGGGVKAGWPGLFAGFFEDGLFWGGWPGRFNPALLGFGQGLGFFGYSLNL